MTENTFTPEDIEKNKGMAAVSYLFVLCFIPLVAAKDSKFAQFHAKQGVALFIVEMIIMIVFNPIFLFFMPFLVLVYVPLVIASIVFSIMGIVKALQGEAWEMPIFSQMIKSSKM